jgi:hypothetical protein
MMVDDEVENDDVEGEENDDVEDDDVEEEDCGSLRNRNAFGDFTRATLY